MEVLKLVRKGVYLLRGNLLVEEAENINMDEINDRLTNAGLDPIGSVLSDKRKSLKRNHCLPDPAGAQCR